MRSQATLIWSAAIMTAFRPEPHILLMVVAGMLLGMPAPRSRLPRRRLAESGGQHASHDHFLDVTALQARGLDRGFDRGGAELRGADRSERALKCADGSAFGWRR